jgi:O-antigen biosynthesis protein
MIISQNYLFNDKHNLFIDKNHTELSYKDGSENYLYNLFANIKDPNRFGLYKYIKDWPTRYHLTHERVNLIEAVKELIPDNSRVLEIGAGMGALTHYLADNFKEVDAIEGSLARAKVIRIRACKNKNLRVFVSDISKIELPTNHYDLVVIVGVLEYIPFYASEDTNISIINFLKKIKATINNDGILLLAIENKLGAKYFSGCNEDHNGKAFSGIIDYPDKSPITFSRYELENLLKISGFNYLHFYHLFPDYKIPKLFISEDNKFYEIEPSGLLRGNFEDYSGKRRYLFPDVLFVENLIKANLLYQLSNSFLVLSSKSNATKLKTNLVIRKFWNPIGMDQNLYHTMSVYANNNKAFVRRELLYGGKKQAKLGKIIFNLYDGEWVKGKSLMIDALKTILKNDKGKSFANLLRDFLKSLLREFATGGYSKEGYPYVKGDAIDYSFWNIKYDQNGHWYFIDKKWRYSENITADFVIYRNLGILYGEISPFIRRLNKYKFIFNQSQLLPPEGGSLERSRLKAA